MYALCLCTDLLRYHTVAVAPRSLAPKPEKRQNLQLTNARTCSDSVHGQRTLEQYFSMTMHGRRV